MENIWSENKYVNTTINILLFLLGINFMHYAQLVVPIICVIIFIDCKCKFHINNIKIFIILCLFGISFLIFAFNQGTFAFIGLFLPMIYYIGSNLFEPSEKKIKQVIYILTVGMISHILLNFATDLVFRGIDCIHRNSHLDIWTLDEYPTTQTAANYIFPIGCLYYYLVYETKGKEKYLVFLVSVFMFIYMFALGRRAPIVILLLVLLALTFFDFYIQKSINSANRIVLVIIGSIILIAIFVSFIYIFNLFGIRYELINRISIIRKFYYDGLNPKRLYLIIETIKLAPKYLFGGSHISEITGFGPHELWLDIFNVAGIVPYILFVIYSITSLVIVIETFKNGQISISFKFLIAGVLISSVLEFFIEPIISGASILLLSVVLIVSCVECLQVK